MEQFFELGGSVIHIQILGPVPFFQRDGVHLTDLGKEAFLNIIQDKLEKASAVKSKFTNKNIISKFLMAEYG